MTSSDPFLEPVRLSQPLAGAVDTEARRRPTILVAEDDEDIAGLLERSLSLRYDVAVAKDGPSALSLAGSLKPDLMLLDVAMPGLDGFHVAEHLRSVPAFRHVPVIFITAQVNAATNLRALEMGARDFITKPFKLGVVVDKIQQVLQRR